MLENLSLCDRERLKQRQFQHFSFLTFVRFLWTVFYTFLLVIPFESINSKHGTFTSQIYQYKDAPSNLSLPQHFSSDQPIGSVSPSNDPGKIILHHRSPPTRMSHPQDAIYRRSDLMSVQRSYSWRMRNTSQPERLVWGCDQLQSPNLCDDRWSLHCTSFLWELENSLINSPSE